MGSSFEEFITRNPMMKRDHNSNTHFESYSLLEFSCTEINAYVMSSLGSYGWSDEFVKDQHTIVDESFHIWAT